MVVGAYIHRSRRKLDVWFVGFVGKLTSLSSLLLALHDG
jgi:hypothetical protein